MPTPLLAVSVLLLAAAAPPDYAAVVRDTPGRLVHLRLDGPGPAATAVHLSQAVPAVQDADDPEREPLRVEDAPELAVRRFELVDGGPDPSRRPPQLVR